MSVEELRRTYYDAVRHMDSEQIEEIESGVPCASEKMQQAQRCYRDYMRAVNGEHPVGHFVRMP